MTALATIPVPGAASPILASEFDGTPWAALKPMCEALGISYSAQLKKLKARAWAVVALKATTGSDGKTYEMVMIDRRTVGMWLATIDENRVGEEVRPTIRAYQAEAADALDTYFAHGGVIRPANQYDALRAMINQIEAAERTASEARELAEKSDARLDAIEGRHNWFSALAFAKLNDLPTDEPSLRRLGARATAVAKQHGISANKVQHGHYGAVNSYPEFVWKLAVQ